MSLQEDPIIIEMKANINSEIDLVAGLLIDGKILSFEEYKKRTGTIAGLRKAIEVIDSTIKNYADSEE